jgi:phage virion morphogenesis protein
MSGFSVTVDDARLVAVLRDLQARCGNLKPVMQTVGQTLVTQADLGFRAEKDPWGTPWKKLKAATLRARRGRRKGAKILRDTGRLAGSINYRATADSVTVGTNVIYAAIHQFGGTIQRAARQHTLYFKTNKKQTEVGNRFVRKSRSNFAQDVTIGAHAITIPARPFLPIRNGRVDLPADTLDDILDHFNRYLTAGQA